MSDSPEISVVTPLCDEAQTLRPLFEQIEQVFEKIGRSFEVIFIDDGSRDDSWERLSVLKAEYPQRIRALRFCRNHGKSAALAAGFTEARGRYVITMDADLQDDPAEIPFFLEKLESGVDCVSGWKQLRQDPLSKTLPSRFFNLSTRITSGVQLHDFNCGFKGYRAVAVKSLTLYGELHRYIPVLLDSEGFSVAEIPVKHHRRTYGVSKYGWQRLIKGGLDLVTVIILTRYLKRPGHFFGGLGLLSGVGGFAILSWLSVQKLFLGIGIGGRPLFFLGIMLFLLGFQLISTGLLGELLNFHSTKNADSRTRIAERL